MKITNVRLSHSKLFKPEEYTPGDGRPRRSANFLIEKSDPQVKLIEAEILAKATEDFGNAAKAVKWLASVRGQKTQDCFRPYPDDPENLMNLASHRAAKAGPVGVFDNVVDMDAPINPVTGRRPVRDLLEIDGRPYDGCYVNATFDIYVQTKGENQGVRCGLVGVQFAKDGDAFSGGKKATPDDFDAIDEGADADAIA